MPELPEVETIRRDLAPSLLGRRVRAVRVYHDDLLLDGVGRRTFRDRIRGRRIGRVARRAKFLLFPLYGPAGTDEQPERILRVQLRMTGRFALGERIPEEADFRHPGAEFALDDGRTLFYDDVRRLGGFDLLTPAAWSELESRLGPEPLEPAFTAERLAGILRPLTAPIKNVLLDQRRVAGIGNIYASEALHRAALDPRRPAGELSAEDVRRLRRDLRAVLRAALDRAGTSFRDYRAVNGRSGAFQTRLRVYGREGAACPRCGGTIVRLVQAGRSSFCCPECQR